ncbi:MAG: HAD family hydrolase [Pseudomonadota bacterium]|nr:HAD family hydrolase [Pseudomonadota bacterium]
MKPQPTGFPTHLAALADIRAVIFDIYGTLLISGSGDIGPASAEQNEQAFREALSVVGLPVGQLRDNSCATQILVDSIHEAQAARRSQGIEFPEVDIIAVWQQALTKLFKQDLNPEFSDAQVRRLAIEYECRANPVWPMPGMRDTLDTLRTAGRQLGIVSNAQFYTPLMFQALLDKTPGELGFNPRLCAWSYEALEGKPSVTLFQQVLNELATVHGIRPQQTLYVGNDMLKDIWPATQLGFKTALFAGDRRSLKLREDDERCQGLKPDLVIDHLSQLAQL